ncbi:MAG: aspartate kinase [Litorivivens sp.]|jgi:aspartate kinase
MRVFKFGGASVKNAEAVKNLESILVEFPGDKLVVVVSAMGKMTNKLEEVNARFNSEEDWNGPFDDFVNFHESIVSDLGGLTVGAEAQMTKFVAELKSLLNEVPSQDVRFNYDRIVSYGELLSTTVVHGYLAKSNERVEWLDVRNVIITDRDHGRADVDWDRSARGAGLMDHHLNEGETDILITQGFIGSSNLGNTTTLGREGSDFSAAILGYLCDAQDVTIWKDVPGMLNADPKWFNNTVVLDEVSYREALELSYYGASVIHPKTIKPLQNKEIPLYVKSFVDSSAPGTTIHSNTTDSKPVPAYIFKPDQVLISISPKDFSFIVEENLSEIFQLMSDVGIHINLMQNSALNFSVVVDNDAAKLQQLTDLLSHLFSVKYNTGLKLFTVRHYDRATVDQLSKGHEKLLEQKSRHTLHMALRELEPLDQG